MGERDSGAVVTHSMGVVHSPFIVAFAMTFPTSELHSILEMKRTALKRVGKIGLANIESRKRIAEIAEERCIDYCEIGFEDCLTSMYLSPAHRHKRAWYQGDVELLSDYKQWVGACQSCPNTIEFNEDLTEEVFLRLRGDE